MIGTRIKYFRKRAGLSQLDAEIAIGLSSGVLSRIENNNINPTKESVLKIAEVLKLNEEEIDYLIGKTQTPATEEEIQTAKKSIEPLLLSTNRLLYLLDDRKRLIAVSNGFKKLIPIKWENYIGKSVIELIVDQANNPISRIFKLNTIIKNQLTLYYKEMGYQEDDQIYIESVNKINSTQHTKKIWNEITNNKVNINVYDQSYREIVISIYGIKLKMNFSREKLLDSRRFEIVEYYTDNKILSKILRITEK